MAEYYDAYRFVARWEGGYSCDPDDPGGATNFGVSLRWLKSLGLPQGDIDHDGDIDADDIRDLDKGTASTLFRQRFWDAYGLGSFKQKTATVYFDAMVNTGPVQATKFMQRGYKAVFPADALTVDGKLGPQTRAALTRACDDPAFLKACIDERDAFYESLSKSKPNMSKFLKGWLNRTRDLRRIVGLV